jgi:16S rRNA (uracil1498-N3)-methyltransferase
MSQRFFISTPVTGQHAALTGAEAHHLAHVMRAQPGDRVTLFDGSGHEFSAQIQSISKSRVEVTILERSRVERESSVELTLAVALPKGDRQRWLIEKIVELGVARLVPLITERGVAQPSDSAVARLERAVIEATKQCGRNRLLAIAPARRWEEFATAESTAGLRWLVHPGGIPLATAWSAAGAPKPTSVVAAIGPEGGFSDDEVRQAAAAGWQMVDLGPRILRVETAAVAIAAFISLAAATA